MKVPSMMSLTHGSTSMMKLRNLERSYHESLQRADQKQDVVHLEEMSYSGRMEFLKHDGALRQLNQDKERATLAKVEVTRVLERARSLKKDMARLYGLQLKIERFNIPNTPAQQNQLDYMRKSLDRQRLDVVKRIDDVIDSIKKSDFYNGSTNPISIRPGYSVNASTLGIFNQSREFLVGMDIKKIVPSKSAPSGHCFKARENAIDLYMIPHLSQDLETCEQADSVIDTEIKMHNSTLSKFYVSQSQRELECADAKARLDKFLMFLWDQMRWSREMMKMTHGIS
jgi:hypothetical protein